MGKAYTLEFKNKLVMEVLCEDQPINDIAKKYGVHPQLISCWKADALDNFAKVIDISKQKRYDRRWYFGIK